MTREVRTMRVDQAEVRKADSGALTFTGHAAVFNQRTWIGPKKWGFYEEVDAGFFDDVLDDRAAFLVNHDPNIVLARNGSTMTLSTDKKGLVPVADWDPEDPDAVKWAGRVRRGDVNEMSFAFTVGEEKWSEDDAGNEIRTLLKADRLYDVSLVTYPAYDGTDGGMRDQAAEVVKRHRGFDPRSEQPPVPATTPQPAPAPAAAPQPATDVPAPQPAAPNPAGPPAGDDVPAGDAADVQRALSLLRFRATAARHHLPYRRDVIGAGPLETILDDAQDGGQDDDDDDGEDEDFSTDAGFLSEVVENAQDTIAAATEYLAESDPNVRSADVVTFARNIIAALGAQVTAASKLLG